MTRLDWTPQSEYHAGIDRGVFFPESGLGVAWSGLVAVELLEEDSTTTVTYLDGERFMLVKNRGNFKATIEAFTYPMEFEEYAGFSLSSIYRRSSFTFCYREWTGENTYRIHVIYNLKAIPQDTDFQSIMGDLAPTMFKWTLTGTSSVIPGLLPTSHLVLDSSLVSDGILDQFEAMIYGADTNSRLPSPQEIVDLFELNAIVRVTDNGDGTCTIEGPDEAIKSLGDQEYELSWPSFMRLTEVLYSLSSK